MRWLRRRKPDADGPQAAAARHVFTEQVRMLAEHQSSVLAGVVAAATVLAALLVQTAGGPVLYVWLAAQYGLCLTRLALSRRCRRCLGDDNAGAWAVTLTAGSALSGLLWGAAAFLFLDLTSLINVTGLAIVLMGMTAASLAALSVYPPAYIAYALPTMTMLALAIGTAGGGRHWLIAALAVPYLVANLGYCRTIHRSIRRSLELRFENLGLVERLREQTQRAERANRDKSRFLAAASHDLRQPVHAMGLFLDGLRQCRLNGPARTRLAHLEAAHSELEDLFDALLDISRLDAGSIQPALETICLDTLLARLEDEYRPLAERKGLDLRRRPTGFRVRTDGTLLGRMLRNLLGNALRHTARGGVLIAVRRRCGHAVIEIWDTGPGIAESEREAIFGEFQQGEAASASGDTGVGLGLAIVRRLSELLDHSVSLASRPGSGSVFRIGVPIESRQACNLVGAGHHHSRAGRTALAGFR